MLQTDPFLINRKRQISWYRLAFTEQSVEVKSDHSTGLLWFQLLHSKNTRWKQNVWSKESITGGLSLWSICRQNNRIHRSVWMSAWSKLLENYSGLLSVRICCCSWHRNRSIVTRHPISPPRNKRKSRSRSRCCFVAVHVLFSLAGYSWPSIWSVRM